MCFLLGYGHVYQTSLENYTYYLAHINDYIKPSHMQSLLAKVSVDNEPQENDIKRLEYKG
jgi:hypothetical protein